MQQAWKQSSKKENVKVQGYSLEIARWLSYDEEKKEKKKGKKYKDQYIFIVSRR